MNSYCQGGSGVQPGPPPDEAEILDALGGLAATAHTLQRWVEHARPLIERLVEDYPDATLLARSLAVADRQPPHLGTPRHLERAAAGILAALRT